MFLGFGLGCTGLTEAMMEVGTGSEVQLSEDGDMIMTMEDGTQLVVDSTDPELPGGFLLPPPPGEAKLTQVMTHEVADVDVPSFTAVYMVSGATADVAAHYDQHFVGRGLAVTSAETSKLGVKIVTLEVDGPEGKERVMITDAFGQKTVQLQVPITSVSP